MKRKLTRGQAKAGQQEGFIYGDARIDTVPAVLGVMSFAFMGGSMGSVVGEKITRALERGATQQCPGRAGVCLRRRRACRKASFR